jgi:hypothetical protein
VTKLKLPQLTWQLKTVHKKDEPDNVINSNFNARAGLSGAVSLINRHPELKY